MSNSHSAFAGIDVSAHTLSVALSRPGQDVLQATFDNDPRADRWRGGENHLTSREGLEIICVVPQVVQTISGGAPWQNTIRFPSS